MTPVFVVDACRTPIGKIKGALAEVRPDHLAADVIKALLARNPGLDVAAIQRMLGYSTWAGAQAAIRAGMGEYRGFLEGTSGADMRAYEVARVDWEIRQLMPVLLKPTPKISTTGLRQTTTSS